MRLILDPGSTHGNDLIKMKQLIDIAKGVNAEIKFQLFTDTSNGNIPLNRKYFETICMYAADKNVKCFASVWDREAIELLVNCGCHAIKIAYSQRNNENLVNLAKQTHLEVIISHNYCDYIGVSYTSLWCIPEYPVLYEPNFENIFTKFDGFSDHTLGIHTTLKAIDNGAKIIEKHVKPEDPVNCPDSLFAMSPKETKDLYECINNRFKGKDGKAIQSNTAQTECKVYRGR
jgi:sialic acid synthase SpsE